MSINLVMIGLGVFRFGMSDPAYQTLARSAGYRWGQLNRVGRAPALQYLGPDVQDMTLEGVIHPHFRGGLRQIDLMRLRAGTGIPMMMVDGLGWIWERWCIVSIEERKSYLMRDGAPRQIDFSLTLRSYGSDRDGPGDFVRSLL